jgi:hypothetical protein
MTVTTEEAEWLMTTTTEKAERLATISDRKGPSGGAIINGVIYGMISRALRSLAAERDALKAAINEALTEELPIEGGTQSQEPIGPNETPKEAIKRLIKHRGETERDALKAENASLRATRKWNIERDGEDLLICEGDHEKHEACVAQRWVKSEAAAAEREELQAENARLRETLGLTVTLFKQIMDAIDADPVETVLIARRDGAEVQRITAQECFDKTRALLGKRV